MVVIGECTVPVKPPFLQVHISDFYLIEPFGLRITDLTTVGKALELRGLLAPKTKLGRS